jgi:hypothetical protein
LDYLATALIGTRIAELQFAVAARMMRMNGEAAASAVRLVDSAEQNMDRLADVASRIGANVDLTV